MNLALVDKDIVKLSSAKLSFNHGDAAVRSYAMDVSKIDEWSDLRAKVEMDFGQVQFVMLNAGIGLKSGWEDVEYFHKVAISYPCLSPSIFLSVVLKGDCR